MLEGKRINDRYKVLELIGGGGMSYVYLAHDVILNRDVAIKVLRYDSTNEEESMRRFHREALSATSLMHPNIVSIYDIGEDGDMHYIVMEYVKGKTLKQYIKENAPLSPARSVQIMKQLTSAISHAHENQIIHRDIKPQNILMDEAGNVKITDFGIATSLAATSYTKTNSVIGTVHYLSPEQARGGIATKKSDIYALGIVLYELLTGEVPFSGESAVSIALKHLQAETPSVRNFDASIPQSLENVILKATAKNPDHRYASVEEMAADLETVLSPSRQHEPKFHPLVDNEETKAIPVIKDVMPIDELAKTKEIKPIISDHKKKTKNEEVEKKPTKLKKNRKKLWTIIGAAALVLIIGLIGLVNLMMPDKVEIPDVSNMEVEEATEILEKEGFVIGEIREKNSDEIEEGLVIETDPKAGLSRVKGTEIDLIISIGNEKVEMNDYVGKQLNQVLSIISEEFKDVKIIEEYSNQPEGIIIGQDPAPGEEVVPEDSIVTLTVSKGKQIGTVSDLTGFNQSAMREYEKTSGFKIKIVEEVYSDDIPAGSVVSQDPKPNTKLEIGESVNVVISKGPKQKREKLYVKEVVIPYDHALMGEEQIVRIYIQDKSNTMDKPYDEIKITEDTTYQIQLVIQEGSTASYMIEKDSVIIEKDTIPFERGD
ncbi:Stk1 family PASTA domain-containing Ser/Thr kinase [Ureibacillus thermosphaericus]|uniref:Stk1 family PASTA domain-containing Ser/Thr kinase n=1 Tax=Ureibacillus thermosphaericus TaxID=51173 RepID=UPI000BBC6FD8|nr:Stk1 family PASTA domain-containing Ser/Thr kinase [Ureibacillus thermosphaericus]